MKKFSIKSTLALLLAVSMLSVTTSYAETTQKDIDKAKDKIGALQEQKQDAEDKVDNIKDKKQGLESDLGTLNGQLNEIISSMNELEKQIAKKQEEIEQAAADLQAAEERSAKQYEDMKCRIQFMYENSSTPLWQTLLESKSISDFLNRTEYISRINQYDRDKLAEFQELQQQIAEQKASLENDMDKLTAMQEDMKKKQGSVNSLISTTKAHIAQTDQELADARSDVQELDDKLKKMIEYEKQLEIQKAKEDAARLEEIRKQEQEDTSGVVYVPTDSDAYLLGAIIQCESDGEPYTGKLAVGSVVLNRVKSSYFPNTISGVIYQGGQFSPVASGRLAYRLEAGVNNTCLKAAQEVLGGNITTKALYFRTNNGIIQGTVIGNHVFY